MNMLPKIALGTWLMGGAKVANVDNDDAKNIATIRLAINEGITLIDTAQNYAEGKCEQLVGLAVAGYPREKVKILTKQSKNNLSYNDVIEGCYSSLKRLNTTFIDYFVCHAPNPDFDLVHFFKACNKLYKDGLIRHVGVSNFGVASLQKALDNSEIPIALNQVSFSINDSDIFSSGTYDFCIQHNIPIQAYRPLLDIKKYDATYGLLVKIAEKMNVTPHQIALAFLSNYTSNFTIRASSIEHWSQIKNAFNIELEPTDFEKLRTQHSKMKGDFGRFLES